MRAPGIGLRVLGAACMASLVLVGNPASVSAARPNSVSVLCSVDSLASAINAANAGGTSTLALPRNCTYLITTPATPATGLPTITGTVTLQGNNSTIARDTSASTPDFRLMDVSSTGNLTVQGVNFSGGSAAGLGGAISSDGGLTVNGSTFSGNSANNGGAIYTAAGSHTSITLATFTGNTTTGVGGGGLMALGQVSVVGSQFIGNTAPVNGGAINVQAAGTVTVTSSTFTGNTSGGFGGALSNLGHLQLLLATVQGNTGSSGGAIASGNSNVTISNSKIRNNNPDNCNPLGTIPGCTG